MKIKLMDKYEPQVFISKNAYDKTMEYINQSKQEIGWLATASRVGKDFYIHDTYLFKQEVSSVTTEIKEDGLNEFAMELMQQPDGMDIWNNMRVWGHSHVNMSPSPSGQDNDQMKLFLDNPNDFFIRIIGNKSEEFKVDIWDFESGIIYEDATFSIVYDEDTENILNTINKQIKALRNRIEEILTPSSLLQEEIKLEISEKVKEKKYSTIYGNNCKGQGMYGNIYDDVYGIYDGYGYDGYDGYGSYGANNYGTDKDKKKEKESVDVNSIFNALSEDEIFIIMEGIDQGYSSSDMLDEKKYKHLTIRDFEELDEEICNYCFKNQETYTKYLISQQVEG